MLAFAVALAGSIAALLFFPPGVPPRAVVSCDSVIDFSSTPSAGDRVLFGRVAVAGKRVQGPFGRQGGPFPYFAKAGIEVARGRASVDVIVPRAWRRVVAIGWGDGAAASIVRLPGRCRSPGKWLAYAGGFHLRRPTACVPLIVRAGDRSTSIRFGIGRACPPRG